MKAVEAQSEARAHCFWLARSHSDNIASLERKKGQPLNPTMATTFPDIAIPGQPLAPAASYTPGTGVHIFNDRICASVVGQPQLSTPTSPPRKEKDQDAKQILSVLRPVSGKSEDVALVNLLPQVGSTVLARVTRINPRQATVEIFVVGDTVSNDEFQGIIR